MIGGSDSEWLQMLAIFAIICGLIGVGAYKLIAWLYSMISWGA